MRRHSNSAAKFLRRGEHHSYRSTGAASLDIDASVIFEDEAGTDAPRSCSPARSPKPSQLTLSGSSQYLPRQRPRFHTVQDLDLALNQAIEGRINSKNAWASKEASDLLEGITHTIESTLEANAADDYSGFTKAATVVEGCSKVWTIRVDSTYQQSNQMVRRLLRNDDTTTANGNEEEGGQEESGNDVLSGKSKTKKGNAVATTLARTLALNAAEINLDSKARTTLTQTGINAQFRAITEKFDQGNAHGLLMNNAPLGSMGNLILDIDYSRYVGKDVRAESSSRKRKNHSGRDSGRASDSAVAATGVKRENNAETDQSEEADDALKTPRLSWACVEEDTEVDAQVDDLPEYIASPFPESASDGRISDAGSSNKSKSVRGSIREHAVSELLALSHAAIKHEIISTETALPAIDNPMVSGPSVLAASHVGDAESLSQGPLGKSANVDDDGYDFTGNDYWDEADGGAVQEDGNSGALNADQAAVQLVSGAYEMQTMDSRFVYPCAAVGDGSAAGGTVQQLALEAEDPSSWCSLADIPSHSHSLLGTAPRSELSRLHREHKLLSQPQRKQLQSSAIAGATGSMNVGSPAKRPKKERTVVFDLGDTAKFSSDPLSRTACPIPSTDPSRLNGTSSVLKQSTTVGKNMTPLGKEVLIHKDASSVVLAYTQSSVQRSKAEEANLVLPPPPVPGKTIPGYLPYPVDIPSFFQPFSTAVSEWNLLRKSASGQLMIGTRSRNTSILNVGCAKGDHAALNGVDQQRYDDGDTGEGGCLGYDMPMEYFPTGADLLAERSEEDYMGYDLGGELEYSGSDDYDPDKLQHQEHQRLLMQFEAQAAAATVVSSTRTSKSEEGAIGSGTGAELDPMELVRIFRSPEAFLPTQVDVVRLRQVMWEAVQELLGAGLKKKDPELLAAEPSKKESEVGESESDSHQEDEESDQPPTAKGNLNREFGMLKRHMQSILQPLKKKKQHTDLNRMQEQECKENEESGRERSLNVTGVSNVNKVNDLGDGNMEITDKAASESSMLRFSDVVGKLLPVVQSISSTGTLSPAFFFFSILFLANEHNLVLENVSELDNLIIRGIAKLSPKVPV
ncbi:unnamed protein product [Phytomonas sp. EM1]|nr:unnamed protein product [Phytomonas sp. EM1]|eukprot:CCW61107.1 unnamed protein product [Phytomonas sp. isolate EM1]